MDAVNPPFSFTPFAVAKYRKETMNPSRYMLVDERFPYPVKRRSRGLKTEKGSEPAVTLLTPDPYLIMERPNFTRSSSPTIYRTAPPKSAKNKQASSFVILGETVRTPVQSRPASPSGRVSPFRGRGFKSPNPTRPNSRIPSPSDSPRKPPVPAGHADKPVKMTDRPRVGRDIGLPPKSPVKSKILNSEVKPSPNPTASKKPKSTEKKEKEKEGEADAQEDAEKTENEAGNEGENEKIASEESVKPPEGNRELQTKSEDGIDTSKNITDSPRTGEAAQTEKPLPKQSQSSQIQNLLVATGKKPKLKLTPVTPRDSKPPASPSVMTKTKPEGNETVGQQSVIKKATKPPLPPKKIGMRATLKTDQDQNKGGVKEGSQGKSESNKGKEKEDKGEARKKNSKAAKEKMKKENEEETEIKKAEVKETEEEKTKTGGNVVEKKAEENDKKPEAEEVNKAESKGKGPEKAAPCFQPDKCQIAPPTMASPSPIITPTISTPSATSDLSTSPMKNSQSIAAAPTTVTPSSLSSVSSTVVLTGNLVTRREPENRNRPKETEEGVAGVAGVVGAKEPKDSGPLEKVSAQMVKAASRDSVKWSGQVDSLSGEITSATKLIKAEPEMEVLSPNNLGDSPPRMPPPNVAWDEGRLPNGDVANKAETEGKMRRLVSAVWKFLCYLFCCRCCGTSKCCRRASREGAPKPSFLSRLNCCKGGSCRIPFACCTGCCCKCKWEGKKFCRRKKKPENPKPKSRKCCAKVNCSCCCDKVKSGCLSLRHKINNICRSLFCLNTMCCQNLLRKFKFCHNLKCCQKNGFCSCCNPNVKKKETKKLNKKGSRASNNSRDKDNLDVVLVEHTSLMKAAIPVLPSCLAVFCLILNLFVPGFGTFISGILCLCFGKPRFSVKDTPKNRVGSFVLNTIIGVAQLFTVVFCLVGWGWSVWWGVIMYKLSRRQKRLKLAEKNQKEAEGSNVNHNHVDVEQG